MPAKSFRSSGTSVAVPPSCLDLVVELLEPAHGARDRDHMRACSRERERRRAADAARRAGDERDAPLKELLGH